MFYTPPGFHTRWFSDKITKIFIKDGVSIKMFLFYLFECGPCEASAREPTKRYLGDRHGQRGRPLLHAMKLQWMVITCYNPSKTPFLGVIAPGPPCRKFVNASHPGCNRQHQDYEAFFCSGKFRTKPTHLWWLHRWGVDRTYTSDWLVDW